MDSLSATRWLLAACIAAAVIKLTFFPSDDGRPAKLADLAGCYAGPKSSDIRLVRFDSDGTMAVGDKEFRTMIVAGKDGEFIAVRGGGGILFERTGQSLHALWLDDGVSLKLSADYKAIAFPSSSDNWVIFDKVACPESSAG